MFYSQILHDQLFACRVYGTKKEILIVKYLGTAAIINVKREHINRHNASVHMLLHGIFVDVDYKYKVMRSCNCALQTKL